MSADTVKTVNLVPAEDSYVLYCYVCLALLSVTIETDVTALSKFVM